MAKAPKNPKVPQSLGFHRTTAKALDDIEALVRKASIIGLCRGFDEEFAKARAEVERHGYFAGLYFEWALAFGVSVSLSVGLQFTTYKVETALFNGDVKKFVRCQPDVRVNIPSMAKYPAQAMAFATLVGEVSKLALAVETALSDSHIVQFVEEK